jgi:hypothetical protein
MNSEFASDADFQLRIWVFFVCWGGPVRCVSNAVEAVARLPELTAKSPTAEREQGRTNQRQRTN